MTTAGGPDALFASWFTSTGRSAQTDSTWGNALLGSMHTVRVISTKQALMQIRIRVTPPTEWKKGDQMQRDQ